MFPAKKNTFCRPVQHHLSLPLALHEEGHGGLDGPAAGAVVLAADSEDPLRAASRGGDTGEGVTRLLLI